MPLRPFRWLLAAVLLAAAPASALADGDALTPAQKTAVETMIHDYLMSHPEVIVQSVKGAQQADEAQAATATRQAIKARHAELYSDPTSPVGGNPKGDVTIVEFFDYRCPYCKAIEPTLETLLKEDGKLRIVYKEFPILGPASVYASRVALAAHHQHKYAAFHKRMMAQKGQIDDAVVLETAAAAGLDVARIKAEMNAPDIDRIIKADYALADAINVQGTPAFVIGDTLVPGVADIGDLRKLIAEARQGG